jgi:hypothetical protein
MTDGTPTTLTPTEPTDAELDRLKLQKAKLALRGEIATARVAALASFSPGVTDGPTGTVTLGADSGALAPWLAHRVLAEVGTDIADAVRTTLHDHPLLSDGERVRPVILVTQDRDLLAGDVVGRQIHAAMSARTRELVDMTGVVCQASNTLESAIGQFEEREAAHERHLRAAAQSAENDKPAAAAGEKEEPKAEEKAAAPAGSAIATAVDLVRLLATDFTITAAKVSTTSDMLAMLTAGTLPGFDATGGADPSVILDGFTVAGADCVTLREYEELATTATTLSVETQRLSAEIAPLTAAAAELRRSADKVLAAWTAATTDEKAAPGSADELKRVLDELDLRVIRRASVAAAAQEAVDNATALITAVQAELTVLSTVDANGVSPLLRAASREGLHSDPVTITHVLHVETIHAGADVVTRRSVLGSSGRVGYLGAVNAGWILVDSATGRVHSGAARDRARQLTHDLTTGQSIESVVEPGGSLGDDPLAKNEDRVRAGVLALALAVALLGVAAVAKVILDIVLAF